MKAIRINIWKTVLITLTFSLVIYLFWPRHYIDESRSDSLMKSECQQNQLYKALALKFKSEPLFRSETELTNLISNINNLIEKSCGEGYAFKNGSFHVATGEQLKSQAGEDFFSICIIKKQLPIYKKEKLNDRYYLFKKNGNTINSECAP